MPGSLPLRQGVPGPQSSYWPDETVLRLLPPYGRPVHLRVEGSSRTTGGREVHCFDSVTTLIVRRAVGTVTQLYVGPRPWTLTWTQYVDRTRPRSERRDPEVEDSVCYSCSGRDVTLVPAAVSGTRRLDLSRGVIRPSGVGDLRGP